MKVKEGDIVTLYKTKTKFEKFFDKRYIAIEYVVVGKSKVRRIREERGLSFEPSANRVFLENGMSALLLGYMENEIMNFGLQDNDIICGIVASDEEFNEFVKKRTLANMFGEAIADLSGDAFNCTHLTLSEMEEVKKEIEDIYKKIKNIK